MTTPTRCPDSVPPHLNLGWHIRERILPSLAKIDRLSDEIPRAHNLHDLLIDHDLGFDLRGAPHHPSNLCEDNSALELAYTFGDSESCGLRYSYEPTAPPGVLRNRYTLFRDRMICALRHCGSDAHLPLFHEAYRVAVPRELSRGNTTLTIAAVHHYRGRRPRVKAYFSCDYDDPRRARAVATRLLELLDEATLLQQWRDFVSQYRPRGGMRMVGLDFEPGQAPAIKLYRTGEGLTRPALERIFDQVEASAEARAGLRAFEDVFLDGRRRPAEFDLIALAPRASQTPSLKLYIRPVDFYGDGETLRRLRRWYAHIDQNDALHQVERGLATVAPLDVLEHTRGFFNYLSVDLGSKGLSKTSVYFTPQIALSYLARTQPKRLQQMVDRQP